MAMPSQHFISWKVKLLRIGMNETVYWKAFKTQQFYFTRTKKLDRTRNVKTFKETAYFYLASNHSITVRVIYTWLIKPCQMQSINHEWGDTMEFWEDSSNKLATWFHILIFKIFSFLRRFWSRYGHPVLTLPSRCRRREPTFPASQKTIGSYRSWYMLFTRQHFFI